MSAQVYPPQNYYRVPQIPIGPPRRAPLANVVGHPHNQPKATPPKPQEKQKEPASPPLPRQNSKTVPPSPPKIIRARDTREEHGKTHEFHRVGFLGEGGFARVYEVTDDTGARLACKVVTKSSLKTKKAKTKLYAEIKIHNFLQHPNIVNFQNCYEDEENVYMTLELCHSGSLMDMLRRRRRFTEPEARFFMVQLIGACHYMHTHQVIHRDLKLGNLFLDGKMNVKVGDFGLAALIENEGERKKTICGTPNYIAPEVLFDTANGHSFEVDTWSIGVILYTLAVGRPPFQTKEVKEIYKRIRDNDYEFPADRKVSSEAKELTQLILAQDPQMRPTLHSIIDHAFFTEGLFPPYIPVSAYDTAPDFRHVTRLASGQNYNRIRSAALLDEETSIAVPKASSHHSSSSQSNTGSASAAARNVTSTMAQQEKEFQKAVQPGSPISALLSSARQPLMMNPAANNGESTLLRKLQAAQVKKESPLRTSQVVGRATGKALQNISEEDVKDEGWAQEQFARRKELESQKARIVAQMAPAREDDRESLPPPKPKERAVEKRKEPTRERVLQKEPVRERQREPTWEREMEKEREKEQPYAWEKKLYAKVQDVERENIPPIIPEVKRARNIIPLKETRAPAPLPSRPVPQVLPVKESRAPAPVPRRAALQVSEPVLAPISSKLLDSVSNLNTFDAAAHILSLAFDAKAQGKLFRDPREDKHLPMERVFIASWVDYCNKYGMAYGLTDGSVGVYFNDTTTLVLSADKQHFDYITSRNQGAVFVRKSYSVENYPEELKGKVYLLKHFEIYISDKLMADYDFHFQDLDRTKGMEWVQIWLRMKSVIVFKLSHDVLQFNFNDHSKLILSSHGLAITYIDKTYSTTKWTLSTIMAKALKSSSDTTDQGQFQRMMEKLKYCKEVLFSIQTASASKAGDDSGSATSHGFQGDGLGYAVGRKGLSTKASKASMR